MPHEVQETDRCSPPNPGLIVTLLVVAVVGFIADLHTRSVTIPIWFIGASVSFSGRLASLSHTYTRNLLKTLYVVNADAVLIPLYDAYYYSSPSIIIREAVR